MSIIKDLLNDPESVLVLDVDGVLAIFEFGDRNHYYGLTDEDWRILNQNKINLYTEDKVSKRMQDFLKKKDNSRLYVITKVEAENEDGFKKVFANKYYNIPFENIYDVSTNEDKADVICEIKKKYPNLDDSKVIMIDDTVDILTDVMRKTNFSTCHISSFLDI